VNDEQAIRDLIETWMNATREGDSARVLELMADDVVFMVPGKPPFGREAFAAQSESLKGVRFDGKSEVLEISVQGDWAWCRTKLAVTTTMPDGTTNRRSGHTLSIFRKDGGRWRLARDANLLAAESSPAS
jgi:uncharacterized protein (TIGR02246 family)